LDLNQIIYFQWLPFIQTRGHFSASFNNSSENAEEINNVPLPPKEKVEEYIFFEKIKKIVFHNLITKFTVFIFTSIKKLLE
jgi:hypothetical protein